jgi:secreted trypsin-like serine protease
MGSNQKNSNLKLTLLIFMLSIGLALGCGTPAIPPSFGARIINGEEAKPNSWPWMVLLLTRVSNSTSMCGGSIIDQNTILTAAHCVDRITSISQINVYVGLHSRLNNTQTNISVTSFHIHPQWNRTTIRNDVAIIKLRNALTFSDRVSPVCLPSPNSHSSLYGKNVVATGWGVTQTGNVSTFLQQAQLKVINENFFYLLNGTIFASSEQYAVIEYNNIQEFNNSDTNICSGDSGGPLVYFDGKKWTIFGVTSYGFDDEITGKCLTNFPSFFQSVPFYLDFINSYLNSTSISSPVPFPTTQVINTTTPTTNSSFQFKQELSSSYILIFFFALLFI